MEPKRNTGLQPPADPRDVTPALEFGVDDVVVDGTPKVKPKLGVDLGVPPNVNPDVVPCGLNTEDGMVDGGLRPNVPANRPKTFVNNIIFERFYQVC